MKKAQVYAKLKNAGISPKKVRVMANVIRGKSLIEAKLLLSADVSKAARILLKVLKSAEANAGHNNNLNSAKLFIAEIMADEGRYSKGAHFIAKSRVNPIIKRSSHLTIGLSEKGSK